MDAAGVSRAVLIPPGFDGPRNDLILEDWVWEQAGKAGDRTRCREGLGPLATELRRALADIDRMNAAAK